MGEFANVLGPLVLGIFLNTYIYGIVAFQYAVYYNTKYKDPLWIRLPVVVLFVVDTFQTATGMYILWSYCVENFVNPNALNESLWAYSLMPVLTGVSGLIAHIFLAHRVYVLTDRKILHYMTLGVAVSVFVLAGLTGILVLIKQVSMGVFISQSFSLQPVAASWLILQPMLGVYLQGSLLVALLNRPPALLAGFSTGNRMLRLFTQTGAFATVFSLLALFTFTLIANANVYFLFCVPIGRLYSNAVLDTLLARGKKSTLSETNEAGAKAKTADIWVPVTRVQGMPSNTISLNNIHVKTEVYSDGDPRAQPRTGSNSQFDLPQKIGPKDEIAQV